MAPQMVLEVLRGIGLLGQECSMHAVTCGLGFRVSGPAAGVQIPATALPFLMSFPAVAKQQRKQMPPTPVCSSMFGMQLRIVNKRRLIGAGLAILAQAIPCLARVVFLYCWDPSKFQNYREEAED